MTDTVAVKDCEHIGNGNPVVAAERGAVCPDIVLVFAKRQTVLFEVDSAFFVFDAYHVGVSLQNDGRARLITGCSVLEDDDVSESVF